MEYEDFVKAYKAGELKVHIDRSAAMHVCDIKGALPQNYYWAHIFWKNTALFAFIGGLLSLFWTSWYVGLGVAGFGLLAMPAVQKTAAEFVLKFSLEDSSFYSLMREKKVLKVEEA